MLGRKTLSLFGAFFALMLFAAACGNSDDSGDDGGTETTTSAADGGTSETDPPDESTTAAPEGADEVTPEDEGEDDAGSEDGGEEIDTETFVPIEGVPGVSDEEISFAVIATEQNNPLGTCILECYRQGIQAYFDYANENGGLFGRQLVVGEVLDDELSNNQIRATEVIANDNAFGVFSATLLATGWGDLNDAGIPTFVWNIHATETAGREAIFGQVASLCADCLGRILPYIIQDIGATKIASLGYGISDNSKVCANTSAESVETYSDNIGGAEIVYLNDQLEFGLSGGVATEVSAMIDAEVDFVMSCLDLNGMKTLAEEFQRQGHLENVTLHHPNSYNHGFVEENAALFEGDIVIPAFLPYEAEVPDSDLALVLERFEADGIELSEHAMIGWINAAQAFDAIKFAGPEFDRQKAIDGLNSQTSHTIGLLNSPIDWTRQHEPESRDGGGGYENECSAVVRIADGAFETVAPPDTPWICWDNSNNDWAEAEFTATP